MSGQVRRQSLWHILPLSNFVVSEYQLWRSEETASRFDLVPMPEDASTLPPYPVDMQSRLSVPYGYLDEGGVPYSSPTKKIPGGYHPTTISQYALAQWNAYLATKHEKHRQSFMIQANWLVEHEVRFSDDAGGWPFAFPLPDYNAPVPWLSALTQGNAISVLVRAYRLNEKNCFLQVARRAACMLKLDIRDGGVSAFIGENGVFFEEVAAFPAAHILNGYMYALFGLYDYVDLTGDAQIAALIQRSLVTLHTMIDAFDMGYWSRYDLLHRHPAPPFYHALHVTMLKVLARYSDCEHCALLAERWASYQQSSVCRLCYLIVSRFFRYRRGFRRLLRRKVPAAPEHAFVTIPAPFVPLAAINEEAINEPGGTLLT